MLIQLKINNRCNYNCSYCCDKPDNNSIQIPFDFDGFNHLIQELRNNGEVPEIFIIGGESFTYPNFIEVLQFINSKKILCTIQTNGFLLPSFYKELKLLDYVKCSISYHHIETTFKEFLKLKAYQEVCNEIVIMFDSSLESIKRSTQYLNLLKNIFITCSIKMAPIINILPPTIKYKATKDITYWVTETNSNGSILLNTFNKYGYYIPVEENTLCEVKSKTLYCYNNNVYPCKSHLMKNTGAIQFKDYEYDTELMICPFNKCESFESIYIKG